MKKLTKTGENFIKTICSGSSNSLIAGKYNYNLPFSNIEDTPTTFIAAATDHNGTQITSNQQLGDALISWYNEFAELLDLDANLLAAQGYAESKYRLWHYAKDNSGSGLADLVSIRVYRHIVRSFFPETEEALASPKFTLDEINTITHNLTNPSEITSYVYRGANTTLELALTAISNRQQLHQNIINNPKISIKAQAIIMSEISARNNAIATNTLFAYDRNYLMSERTYPLLLDRVGRRFGDDYVKHGIDYVERVFRYLGDKDNNKVNKPIDKPKGIWFGYKTDFTVDNFNAFLG